ncbi:helix-turn-helix domain-containing protein [Pediococcus acidilactici]|uniref:helix-turn-helix domain-containing protein n=1 Tax=Pediococcus acidilactici TaxID=1254 RepID=UPI001330A131|nr:helix-turn-helix transcriptional regulator [Pediococcus acidilactici]KAF0354764.1 helix-turn-helix domain-containing protein [Pediococcus acidilactici]KAF0358986.1 helix-turn-helix domain-containing protein [Pediococcus acidilactici]KAF0439779.1 helix-turn-helix domain-containing protein [Pediococcus acidilactici]KAF0448206.1 helix-turn-helix domain-containing protein [Pediococcus acidilactici]KAF0558351.1 helix-turn-helix domain-containing protein [Pediococcus acidilactici]
MTVFDRIKKLGKRRGYNISQIETELGLGTNSIYNWKKRTPTADNLAKVAKLLHTSTDYLLGLSDEPSPDNNDMTKNQKLIAHSIDPDVTDEEREIIIGMVKEAMKFRRRL